MMEEEWKLIAEFPSYKVSNHGRIFNIKKKRMVALSRTKQGAVKVGLYHDDYQHTRSVKVLVAEHFVKGRTKIFDTPMQLDLDQNNCRSDNLVWRPRWFTWKYSQQFAHVGKYDKFGPIFVHETERLFINTVQAAITYGMLFEDIHKSVTQGKPAFPLSYTFTLKN
jgi:hypothetical protein